MKKKATLYLYSDGWHLLLSNDVDVPLDCARNATYHEAWAHAKVRFPEEVIQ